MSALRTAALGLVCLASLAARASELETQPTLTWTVHFGGAARVEAPAVSLGLRAAGDRVETPVPLAQLDLDVTGTELRVAGLPLVARRYRLGQAEYGTDGRVAEQPASKPWYARSWVLWTGAGLAATAALAGAGGGGGGETIDQNVSGRGGVLCGGAEVGGAEVNEDDCVVPCPGPGPNSCIGNALDAQPAAIPAREPHSARLDAGTGGMGDLIAR